MTSDVGVPIYELGVELLEPNHWVAYALDLPGCFSSGKTEEAAVEGARERIRQYFGWLASHGEQLLIPDSVRIRVAERYVPPSDQLRDTSIGEIYIVNAFFRHDSRPVTEEDLLRTMTVLSHQREDLLSVVASEISPEAETILLHIGSAELWYWERLDMAFPREDLPNDWAKRLSSTREFTLARLPALVELAEIREKMGEAWSGRKLVRRLAWHERDHTSQIGMLLSESTST